MILLRSFLLAMFLLYSADASVCYTAENGSASVKNTEKKFADKEKKLLAKIDDIGKVAKDRADKELQIKSLNNKIVKIRTANLLILKRIKFNMSKGQ